MGKRQKGYFLSRSRMPIRGTEKLAFVIPCPQKCSGDRIMGIAGCALESAPPEGGLIIIEIPPGCEIEWEPIIDLSSTFNQTEKVYEQK